MSVISESPESKDPEEEFFRMIVLSLKMLYNEKQPDTILKVNPKQLFE